MTYSRSYFRNY